jgi:hypothetical protein
MVLNATVSPGVPAKTLRRTGAAPWEPLYQLAVGFLVVPVFGRLSGRSGSDWRLLPFFLLVLIALRVVPAMVRHLLPFSAELKAHWFNQRALAKRYDSYQWRKLFWLGLGLAGYVALYDRDGRAGGLLAAACLVSGALGLFVWRRVTQKQQSVGSAS